MSAGRRPALGCDRLEAATVLLQLRGLARERLPSLNRDIDVLRQQLDGEAGAPCDLRSDDGRAGTRERLVDGLTGRRVVLDRPLHALHRLLGAVLKARAFAR